MSTLEHIKIKSILKDYIIIFTDDFSKFLEKEDIEETFIIIDRKISNLYRNQLKPFLKKGKYFAIDSKEQNKNLDYINSLIKLLISNNIKKTDKLIAIGGGIIHDITGFTASILFRGLEWNCYPTTLLAQSDSCIGSKTSINIGDFKNQVGSYYPPSRVILDINFLGTLTKTDIKSGLGEIIKVHFLDGMGSMEYITAHYEKALKDTTIIKNLILRSLIIKKKIIEKDEFDKDYRNILNYGHTFGHAIESALNYKVNHGQAVTMGMDIANYISLKKGLLSKKIFDKMDKVLSKNRPSYILRRKNINLFLTALSKDKKNVNKMSFSAILTKGPGKMFKVKIPFDDNFKNTIDNFIRLTI